nr:MAG TPA: hypothetical protein [Caudoviricetes sp.]
MTAPRPRSAGHRSRFPATCEYALKRKKRPSPSIMLREGRMLKNGCKKFHGHYSAANFSTRG